MKNIYNVVKEFNATLQETLYIKTFIIPHYHRLKMFDFKLSKN